jgi:hypothetical protein
MQLRGDRPMRISIQLRAARPERRWQRSVYIDGETSGVDVSFDEMRAAEPRSGRVDPAAADSLLFVVDTTNTLPTHGGTIWIGDVEVQRLERADQVRTVSNR